MKKSIWIFLFAVLLPGFVLGWLALRSAEEQQIIFERRTAELYQKETETLAASARDVVEAERRAFGDTVHRLLARSDAEALARDFTNSLMDAWPRKAVGFVLGPDGEMLSPTTTMAATKAELRDFLWNNGSFLCSTQPAVVYPVQLETSTKGVTYAQTLKSRAPLPPQGKPALSVANGPSQTVLAQKGLGQMQQQQAEGTRFVKEPIPTDEGAYVKQALPPAVKAKDDAARQQLAELSPMPEDRSPNEQSPPPRPSAPPGQAGTAEPLKERQAALSAQSSVPPAAAAAASPEPAALPATRSSSAGVMLNRGLVEEKKPSEEMGRAAPKLAVQSPAADQLVVSDPDLAKRKRELAPSEDSKAGGANPAPTGSAAPAAPGGGAGGKEMAAGASLRLEVQGVAGPEVNRRGLTRERIAPATTQPALKYVPESPEPRTAQDRAEDKAMKAQFGVAVAGRLGREGEIESLDDAQRGTPTSEIASNTQSRFELSPAPVQSSAMFNRYNAEAPNRMVEPQQQVRSAVSNWSAVLPATADFRALTAGNDEGMLARFVQDKLDLVFWIRPPEAPEMVFGCLIEAGDLEQLWKEIFASRVAETANERPPFVLALLNDKARPVATFPASETARDWKRPFVANEIGEVLPHWEAALYLATPTAMADTARGLRRTLSFTIAGAIALIAIGGWLVVHDVRRQLALAQQKTDFVSNVSHELKTPLTSIRMFAELMHDRPPAVEKQGQYLRIIRVEAERLTRLINNVLDFAKLERRQRRFEKKPLDLCDVITRVWEGQEMHLRDAGFTTRWQAAPGPYSVQGDEDALAQILVNLLSNAEKYSQEHKDIELVTWLDDAWVNASILDRGIGVPDGEEKKIFEAFYRAHDSLSSGIQGSGLGLTLAQRVAREHGGEIVFERRQGGGSRFTLRIPRVHEAADDASARAGQNPGAATA